MRREHRVSRTKSEESSDKLVAKSKREMDEKGKNPFAKIGLFFQQVIAELKKVVTPTRKELFRYTAVVLAFVVIMMALVAALDFVFSFGASWVFGDGQELFPAPIDPVTPEG